MDALINSRKRKRDISEFPLNDLNQDLLERVLSWLPTSSFLRLTSVCKRWKSVSHSSFKLACNQIPSRRSWFLMIQRIQVCDPEMRKSFFEYPRLLPAMSKYSIDLVEVEGRMCVVLLSEFLETASLRRAAMQPWMSHGLYGKKADVNCAGGGYGKVLFHNSRYVMCDLGENEWEELPECTVEGGRREFVSAFSFEPRIEV
ncbi:hypothetical protein SASPL_149062 [Salvia splendens]|uniref:F-box domain-containing protein n=1 Tax=Salvia splendens TaxID=180675 RepID=A0A8X8WBE3_SALSN|nr:hypothetical protein SASPL_149062 [Salvia splendens]